MKEQEVIFNEMIQSKHIGLEENYKLGLPGNLGKFISDTLKETIGQKHKIDVEDERRRDELIKEMEVELPKLPDLPPLEKEELNIEAKKLYSLNF